MTLCVYQKAILKAMPVNRELTLADIERCLSMHIEPGELRASVRNLERVGEIRRQKPFREGKKVIDIWCRIDTKADNFHLGLCK